MFNFSKMIDLNGEEKDFYVTITAIPEVQYETVRVLAESCGCNTKEINGDTLRAYGNYNELALLEGEILALSARIIFLENCLRISV